MNRTAVQRILGLLLMVFSLTMLLPIICSIIFQDGAWLSFVEGFAMTFISGLLVK